MRTSLVKSISTEGLVHCLMEASFPHPPIHVGCNGQVRIVFIKCIHRTVSFSSSSNPQGSFARIILEVLSACITISVTLLWLENWCPVNTSWHLWLLSQAKISQNEGKILHGRKCKINMALPFSKCTFAIKRTYIIHDIKIKIRLEPPSMKG